MNPKNAYELRWAGLGEIARDSEDDPKKEPIEREYAPWVHAVFALPHQRVEGAFHSS